MNRKILSAVALLLVLLLAAAAGMAEVAVGDHIIFGSYEQDNDLTNGQEPVEWRVLELKGDEALVISLYALDAKPYNKDGGHASWIKSSLRAWLNAEFYDTAFTEAEKACILTKEIENWRETPTADPVFLLENDQAKQLFANHADRQAKPTDYAIAQGIYLSKKYGPGNIQWWLRSISWESRARAAYVAASGGVMTCGGNSFGTISNGKLAVRPAIYVSLDAIAQMEAEAAAAEATPAEAAAQ